MGEHSLSSILPILVFTSSLMACPGERRAGRDRLLPRNADISRALERPRDPFRDPISGDAARAEQIRLGYLLFTRAPSLLGPAIGSALTCSNCHLNAGQREGGLPLVGSAHAYPQHNPRLGRLISLEERIVSCLIRSLDAAAPAGAIAHENAGEACFPSPRSAEVLALAAYITWLSEGADPPPPHPLEDHERLAPSALDPDRGARLYAKRCAVCHGDDGQGVHLGLLRPGPLWGERSWNDGAGMARTWTLAGFLRGAMPYSSPGRLDAEEAQHIAAFINGKPRPAFGHKDRDYPGTEAPPDAIHYRR